MEDSGGAPLAPEHRTNPDARRRCDNQSSIDLNKKESVWSLRKHFLCVSICGFWIAVAHVAKAGAAPATLFERWRRRNLGLYTSAPISPCRPDGKWDDQPALRSAVYCARGHGVCFGPPVATTVAYYVVTHIIFHPPISQRWWALDRKDKKIQMKAIVFLLNTPWAA